MKKIDRSKTIYSWILKFCCLFLSYILVSGCEKLIEIPPPVSNIAENSVYTTDGTAISVLNGIYISMNNLGSPITGTSAISQRLGIGSDELTLYSGVVSEIEKRYYRNELAASGVVIAGAEYWAPLYNFIFKCNAAIEGLTAANNLTSSVRLQLLGEAKFMRAYFYFYLVNIFGDIPLAISTDAKINTLLARSPKADVYGQIIADLKDAQQLLANNYLDITLLNTTTERVRPTKWAASALLARCYLYIGDFGNAEAQATEVINSNLFGLLSLNFVFSKNSKETIWQIQPTAASYNTREAVTFILTTNGPENNIERGTYLSPQLLQSFEPNDQRRFNRNWVDSVIKNGNTYYFPYKYKISLPNSLITSSTGTQNMSEYLTIFRLGEQFLIRAEARAQLGNLGGAQADLNAIRNRAGLGPTTASDKASLITAILHERQVELFCEFGNRWFDLKRTGNIDAVMSTVCPLKGGTWQTTDQLYPLPSIELQRAPNLVQNPGYE